ncbi:unnamed protein product, partial [Durusdinium trenchii]
AASFGSLLWLYDQERPRWTSTSCSRRLKVGTFTCLPGWLLDVKAAPGIAGGRSRAAAAACMEELFGSLPPSADLRQCTRPPLAQITTLETNRFPLVPLLMQS